MDKLAKDRPDFADKVAPHRVIMALGPNYGKPSIKSSKMATSRKQFTAARLASLPPDEAYQELLSASTPQRKALYENLEKPEYWKLAADLASRQAVANLNRNVMAQA